MPGQNPANLANPPVRTGLAGGDEACSPYLNQFPFVDFPLYSHQVRQVQVLKNTLVLHTTFGRVLIAKKAVSRFLNEFGLRKKDLKENPEKVVNAILNQKWSLIFSCIRSDLDFADYACYRISTALYTPIPHSLLFAFTESVLRDLGFKVLKKKFRKWYRRSGMFFVLREYPVVFKNRQTKLQAGILVTNANTARDAIHVIAFTVLTVCDNTFAIKSYAATAHVGSVSQILQRVRKAIIKVLREAKFTEFMEKLIKAEEEELPKSVIENWIRMWVQRMPQKYLEWFEEVVEENLTIYGMTRLALWQTATYFGTRLQNKNLALARAFQNEARKIIAEVRK